MTNPNDWKSMSEELEVMKAQARHEGYQAAISDIQERLAEIDEGKAQIAHAVSSWNKAISRIRDEWAKMSNQPAQWRDETKDRYCYQLLFGHETFRIDGLGHHMHLPEDMTEFVHAFLQVITKATDFQILLDAFEANPMVKAQWDKLLVMMRMTE
jgi:hypothetical protein